MKKSALKLSFTALSVCLICICSWIALPIGGIPMTLQTFGVALCGFLLGWRGGLSAIAVYLTLGAVGLPVFAGFGGSLVFLFGPTGGFLFGFLCFSFFCGITSRCNSFLFSFLLSFFGLCICHFLGVVWFSCVSGNSLLHSFFLSSLPYLPKDIFSILLARLVWKKIKKRMPNLARE